MYLEWSSSSYAGIVLNNTNANPLLALSFLSIPEMANKYVDSYQWKCTPQEKIFQQKGLRGWRAINLNINIWLKIQSDFRPYPISICSVLCLSVSFIMHCRPVQFLLNKPTLARDFLLWIYIEGPSTRVKQASHLWHRNKLNYWIRSCSLLSCFANNIRTRNPRDIKTDQFLSFMLNVKGNSTTQLASQHSPNEEDYNDNYEASKLAPWLIRFMLFFWEFIYIG